MPISSPLTGQLVTIFGGTGYVGNYVAQALLARGARLRLASRAPFKAQDLKPLANLGQLQLMPCDITREDHVAAALDGAHCVVNLVGAFDGDLVKLMGEAPGTIARLAAARGIAAMVHISAIGADAASPTAYARGKALGEERVLAGFPRATILRPSIIFGKDDNFLNLFGGMIEMLPVLPVFGPEAKLQLVYADGLSAAFAAMPGTPMSRDQWTLLKPGSTVAPGARGFAELGIEPKPLGLFLDKWMLRYRKHGRFGAANERARAR